MMTPHAMNEISLFEDDWMKSQAKKKPPFRPVIKSKFGEMLADILDLNIDTGPWLAGGMVRKIFINDMEGKSDWDIWFANKSQYDCALAAIRKDFPSMMEVFETDNALTLELYVAGQQHKVQLIKNRYFSSATDIIQYFDFSICQLVTDGVTIVTGHYTMRDLKQKKIRILEIKPGIAGRLLKYLVYGYTPTAETIEMIKSHSSTIEWTKNTHDYA